jgi:hypothetical protein
MRIPTLHGVIRRRILVNFRVDPSAVRRLLPVPFRPKLLADAAVAGICLIRLEQIRPALLPRQVGLSSENAAHRIAVCWTDEGGQEREGVYIARRDSGSVVNHLVGGRLFPGEHHRARFVVRDDGTSIDFAMRSRDGRVAIEVRGRSSPTLGPRSRFASLDAASRFFERGSLGYSETRRGDHLDGLTLTTRNWSVEPLAPEHVHSSYFADSSRFPAGSVELDCVLVMRNIEHEWHSAPALERLENRAAGINGRG